MAELLKLVLALTVVTALAGLAIGVTNKNLGGSIAAMELEIHQSAISSVFPKGVKIDEIAGSASGLPEKYWRASANGVIVGYAFDMVGRGYDAAPIKFMAGVAPDGRILGVTVLSHNETPGLGSRVNEIPSTKYIWYPVTETEQKARPWFTEQFEGLSALTNIAIEKSGEWHKLDDEARDGLRNKNAVTAITGSTITTAAFTNTITQKVKGYLDIISLQPAVAINTDAPGESAAPSDTAASVNTANSATGTATKAGVAKKSIGKEIR
ncbi:MAG: FMN-binding protein [Chitinispirillia bacterium]|nr:FMN-binding protein [Chitinispirillia bacterium]MCL2268656.1 FMN-binding protein [Chitinispirillia bacterium]